MLKKKKKVMKCGICILQVYDCEHVNGFRIFGPNIVFRIILWSDLRKFYTYTPYAVFRPIISVGFTKPVVPKQNLSTSWAALLKKKSRPCTYYCLNSFFHFYLNPSSFWSFRRCYPCPSGSMQFRKSFSQSRAAIPSLGISNLIVTPVVNTSV